MRFVRQNYQRQNDKSGLLISIKGDIVLVGFCHTITMNNEQCASNIIDSHGWQRVIVLVMHTFTTFIYQMQFN